jgi:hypothetical protein
MGNLILGKFALENLYYSTLTCSRIDRFVVLSCMAAAEFPHVFVNFKNIFEASLDDFPSPHYPHLV